MVAYRPSPEKKTFQNLDEKASCGGIRRRKAKNLVEACVALEATGTDRVYVLARRDTRRFRYRTDIIVGNILRYFDTIRLQRFTGVLVYVNNVERGQPEIYVVLEEAQIGIRVRESYALDIDRLSMYQESMGLLDIQLSVPPQYGVRPDGDKTREAEQRQRYDLPRISGLMRPFPEQTSAALMQGLTLNDVNSETIRQQIVNNYRIVGSGEPGSEQQPVGTFAQGLPTDNMFTTSKESDKQFDVYPEANIRAGPIYKMAPIGQYRFDPQTGADISQELNNCRGLQEDVSLNLQPFQSQANLMYGLQHCPEDAASIVPCLYSYALLQSKVLAFAEQDAWNAFITERVDAVRQYNSCGAINIEYPEYMMKTPALSSGYLQGDVARFGCYQTHWIKGDNEYKCGIVVDYNNPNSYRFEWNKGSQPWCRSRIKENYFKWITVIFSIVAIIMAIMAVFLLCWCVKQKKIQEQRQYNYQTNTGYTNKARVASVGSLDDAPQLTQRFPARATPATLEPARLSPISSAADLRRPQSRNLFGLNTSV
ncbi:hypothetical protein NECAME_09427 [Necator americanus]|uniref:AMOP domain protein n=1 Tax=Necator americanus TaxID=51031 RepID=W2TGF5_NECAM|nr:hypothetical protein NECAME_09427 [Necator americanus]ETN80107.1 hypothetical protein NECAME_09427 [Necator americanus]